MKSTPQRGAGIMLLCLLQTATFASPSSTDLTGLTLEKLLELPVVSASKYEQRQSEVAAAVSVITRDEIRAFGWRTLGEALNSLPGIHITNDRQYTYLGARGFGVPGDLGSRILININGNRVNDSLYDGAVVGNEFPLDMDLIERIEFIPGPGGAVYGQNAMFGVVNVITRTGEDVGGAELSGAYQSPQSLRQGRASWGKILDNGVDMLVSVSGMRARGENRFFDFGASGVSDVAHGLDGERDREAFARISRGAWSFDFEHGDRRKNDPTGAFFSDPLVPGQFQGDRYLLTQLKYDDRYADDTLLVSGRLFLGEFRYTALNSFGTFFKGTGTSDWRGAEIRLLSTALENHKIMVGFEYQDNPRYNQTFENLVNPSSSIFIHQSGYRAGVYGQDEFLITKTLAATVGLRVDNNNVSGTELSPRAALIWHAAAATTLKAMVGRAHRAPNSFERDYSDGVSQEANPALQGESIDTLEFVVDQRVAIDLNVRCSLYQWTMQHLIVQRLDAISGLSQFQSGGDVQARGIELSADKTWGLGARLRGSLSYQDVTTGNAGSVANSPQLLGKVNFSTPLPVAGVRLGLELQYDGGRQTVDGTNLNAYGLSNVYLTADRLVKGLEISLGVYNLFDGHYQQPAADTNWQSALEQDGRSVRLETRYKF